MIELATTVIVTVASTALFFYWFRYTCLLILSTKTARDYATEVASSHQLSFLQVQTELQLGVSADFDRLQAALDRDFALLTHLVHHAPKAQIGIEDHMLQLNYSILRAWCRTSRAFSATAALQALEEMCQVVAHCANAMGERAVAAA